MRSKNTHKGLARHKIPKQDLTGSKIPEKVGTLKKSKIGLVVLKKTKKKAWAGSEMLLAYFVLPTSPSPALSAGAGLGIRATHLWHRARFLSVWAGFSFFFAVFCVLSFFVPPDRQPGGYLAQIYGPFILCVAQDCMMAFGSSLSRFCRHILAPLSGGTVWPWLIWTTDYSCPLWVRRPSFLSFHWSSL